MDPMPENFRMFRYLDRPTRNWRVAVACGIAAGIAPIADDTTGNCYTATARRVIEPTAGSDPRSAMAVKMPND